jgi:hypothetical protein
MILLNVLLLVDILSLACGWDYENAVIGKGDLKKVKEVLFRYRSLLNESLNQFENTPLMIASGSNVVFVVEYLLACDGIEVNKQDKVDFSSFAIFERFHFYSSSYLERLDCFNVGILEWLY